MIQIHKPQQRIPQNVERPFGKIHSIINVEYYCRNVVMEVPNMVHVFVF